MGLPFAALGSIAQLLGAPTKVVELVTLGFQIADAVREGVAGAQDARDMIEDAQRTGQPITEEQWQKLNAVTDGLIERQQRALAEAEKAEASSQDQQGLQTPD